MKKCVMKRFTRYFSLPYIVAEIKSRSKSRWGMWAAGEIKVLEKVKRKYDLEEPCLNMRIRSYFVRGHPVVLTPTIAYIKHNRPT